jgi:uncharacterized membrane protein
LSRDAGEPEAGSVLLLVLGCAVVALLLLAVVVDASKLFLTRRALAGAADGAALAAAQAVDLPAVYAGATTGEALPLDPATVDEAVSAYLAAADTAGGLQELTVVSVDATGASVTVTLSARARLPLVTLVTSQPDGVLLTVTARARSAVAAG